MVLELEAEKEKELHGEAVKKEALVKSKPQLYLERIENTVLTVLLSAILILIIAQVYFRFFTESSLTWSEELSRFLAVWLVFLGSTVALRRNLHIQMDNLYDVIPRKIGLILYAIRNVVVLAFLVIILFGSLSMLDIVSIQYSPGLGVQMKLVYMILPISMCLMIFVLLGQFILKLRKREDKV